MLTTLKYKLTRLFKRRDRTRRKKTAQTDETQTVTVDDDTTDHNGGTQTIKIDDITINID